MMTVIVNIKQTFNKGVCNMGLFDRFSKKQKKQESNQPIEIKEDATEETITTDFETLKEKERNLQNKLWDKDYYGSEESKKDFEEFNKEKSDYMKSNPKDFVMKGVDLFQLTWDYIDRLSSDEIKIIELAGQGLYYENELNQYEKAIETYNEADKLTMVVLKDEIEQLTKEHGEGNYLFTGKIRQRISICENKIKRQQIKQLEAEAKEMEKTNPKEAIELYNKLNVLNPNLKKYDKRIEILNKKI